jgi:hypothetical protein
LDTIIGEIIAQSTLGNFKQKYNIGVSKYRESFAAMSSEREGVQIRIQEHGESAIHTHCNGHELSLSIATSCQLSLIRNIIDCSYF